MPSAKALSGYAKCSWEWGNVLDSKGGILGSSLDLRG